MPLDPAAQPIVDLLSTVFPDVGGKVTDAAEARAILAQSPMAAAEVRELPKVEDRAIPGPAGAPDVPVRIYWPVADARDLPVVVFYHGGGWVLCGLDTHDGTCRSPAAEVGAVVVSVDYRLAPEHPFPAAADDAYAALEWAAANAASIGGDPGRLAVAGDSAGGNLTAVVAQMARDRGGPPLRFQLLVYPVTDSACDTPSFTENASGYFLTAAHMHWYWDQYAGDADRSQPYLSPLRAGDLTGLPPAHIVTAECDPLRDEGEAYGALLEKAGVPTTVVRAPGMFHGFFGMGEILGGAAAAASAEAFAALRDALE